MKNIGRIFKRDLKAMVTKFFPLAIIGGVCLLPSLYAWFNIFSNWDPYANTANIQIAVYSEDKGYTNEDGEYSNTGDSIVDGLKENTSIGWVFCDSTEEAVAGVYSGAYYAAIVIDENFSYNMYNVFDQDFEKPIITYYENEKKNAVATKITDTAVSTVQMNVNKQFISVVVSTIFESTNDISVDLEDTDYLDEVLARLYELQDQIADYQVTVNDLTAAQADFEDDLDTANEELGTANEKLAKEQATNAKNKQDFVDSEDDILKITKKMEDEAAAKEAQAEEAKKKAEAEAEAEKKKAEELQKELEDKKNSEEAEAAKKKAEEEAEAAKKKAQEEAEKWKQENGDQQTAGVLDQNIDKEGLKDAAEDAKAEAEKAQAEAEKAKAEAEKAKAEADRKAQEEADKAKADAEQKAQDAGIDTDAVKAKVEEEKNKTTTERVTDSINAIEETFDQIDGLLEQLNVGLKDTGLVLDGVGQTSNSTAGALRATAAALNLVSKRLDDVIDTIETIKFNGSADILLNLLQGDPDAYGSFFSDPVQVDTQTVYPVDNYGSAVAPFYTTLAIWVGCTVLVSIVKVQVPTSLHGDATPSELFFGRYFLFLFLSEIQTAIIVIGDILLLHCQIMHPILFYIAAAFASLAFSLLVYSLTLAFGDIGKALAVIIMVIQIAGSGGTYPIEILPDFYRNVYIFFPFPYVINAMREALAGLYGLDYLKYLLQLMIFVAAGLGIGLWLRLPFIKVTHFIEERMEETEMM